MGLQAQWSQIKGLPEANSASYGNHQQLLHCAHNREPPLERSQLQGGRLFQPRCTPTNAAVLPREVMYRADDIVQPTTCGVKARVNLLHGWPISIR